MQLPLMASACSKSDFGLMSLLSDCNVHKPCLLVYGRWSFRRGDTFTLVLPLRRILFYYQISPFYHNYDLVYGHPNFNNRIRTRGAQAWVKSRS